ncbi:MAG: ComF family protein [Ruminococcaceae bacterium]|nr:ComF family protein [Oscillospiraceae bacterium]
MSNILELIKAALYPPKCVKCCAYTEMDACLCPKCLELWEKEKAGKCNKCGRAHTKCTCLINYDESRLFSVFHLAEYKRDTVAGQLVYKMKGDHGPVVRFLAKELYERLQGRQDFSEAVLTYVPRRREAIRSNGSDQAYELAMELGRLSEKEVHTFIIRQGNHAQKDLNSEQRHQNVRKSYFINEKCAELIKGKRIFIVDDIITTGSTVNYLAELLLDRGAMSVSAISVARRT